MSLLAKLGSGRQRAWAVSGTRQATNCRSLSLAMADEHALAAELVMGKLDRVPIVSSRLPAIT